MATSRPDPTGPSSGPAFGWKEHENGLLYAQFEPLERAGVPHAVFGRRGGLSQPPFDSLNTGHTVGDDPESVAANMERICQVLGVRPEGMVTANLVHGTRVAMVGQEDAGRVIPRTDALLTACPEVTLFLRFADCVPLLLYDRRTGAVGLGHAGWKGTLEGIGPVMVRAIQEAFDTQPEDLIVGIGPAIGPCCYQVGPDVEHLTRQALPHLAGQVLWSEDGRTHLDLWRANHLQFLAAGVVQVTVAGVCTACRRDLFFSHRGDQGRTGRFGVAIRPPARRRR